jgi:glycosyltransferase involved in cell wall biosynthesis
MQNSHNLGQGPKISVVIPTYNRASMLSEAINSVLNQDYENWELIIVDNFSTDDTDKILADFTDARIRSTKKPRTGSVAASRNLGFSMATGEWIAFLDSDDLWDSAKLSTTVLSISRGYEFIYHPLRILDENNPNKKIYMRRNMKIKSPIYMNLLLGGNRIALSSVVVKKIHLDTIGGMNESKELYALEDYDAWLRISQLTEKFICIPRFLGSYRVHEDNISQGNTPAYVARGLNAHLNGLTRKQRRRFDGLYTYKELAQKIRSGDFNNIKRKLIFTIRYAPVNYSVRLLIRLLQAIVASLINKRN